MIQSNGGNTVACIFVQTEPATFGERPVTLGVAPKAEQLLLLHSIYGNFDQLSSCGAQPSSAAEEAPYITGNGTAASAAAAAAGTSGEFLIRKSSIPLSRLSSSASASLEGVLGCVNIPVAKVSFPSNRSHFSRSNGS